MATSAGRQAVRPGCLNDQVTFVHVVQVRQEPSLLLAVRVLGEFQAGIAGRVDQRPTARPGRAQGARLLLLLRELTD